MKFRKIAELLFRFIRTILEGVLIIIIISTGVTVIKFIGNNIFPLLEPITKNIALQIVMVIVIILLIGVSVQRLQKNKKILIWIFDFFHFGSTKKEVRYPRLPSGYNTGILLGYIEIHGVRHAEVAPINAGPTSMGLIEPTEIPETEIEFTGKTFFLVGKRLMSLGVLE
jgi:hypothetical protein